MDFSIKVKANSSNNKKQFIEMLINRLSPKNWKIYARYFDTKISGGTRI